MVLSVCDTMQALMVLSVCDTMQARILIGLIYSLLVQYSYKQEYIAKCS